MYCRKCGSYIYDGWDFCMNCGTKRAQHKPADNKSPAPVQPVKREPEARNNIEHTPPAPDFRENYADAQKQKATNSEKRKLGRNKTVAADFTPPPDKSGDKTKIYYNKRYADEAEKFFNQGGAPENNRDPYDDGYSSYYSDDLVEKRVKHPIAAYIVTGIGILNFILILIAYSNFKVDISDTTVELKDYGLWFLGSGALLMLASIVLYAAHKYRYGLEFLGATGFIVSIGAFVVLLLLLGLACYTLLSTTGILDLPKLPADINFINKK